jgi:hypothetical protein
MSHFAFVPPHLGTFRTWIWAYVADTWAPFAINLLLMSGKLLIALQFWEGDRAQALELAKFLADLEPKHTQVADFLLVHRVDCRAPTEIVPHISRKFNAHVYKSPRSETGWPAGCNGMMESTVEWAYCMMEAGRIPKYKAIFLCEADGGPVSRDWLAKMSNAWDQANAKRRVVIAGPLVPDTEHVHEHINGNCMLTGDLSFLKWLVRGPKMVNAGGWDYVLWPIFKQKGAANIHGMRSYYATPHFSLDEYHRMQNEGLIWVHGDKGSDLVKWGRQELLNYVDL